MPWEDFQPNALMDPNINPETGMQYAWAGQQVAQPSPWEYAQNQNTGFLYSPQQLGWDDATAQRFASSGITKLPGWFNRDLVYSGAFHLGSRDPVENFINLYSTPYDQATGQWDASKKAYNRLFLDPNTAQATDIDVNSDAAREAYLRDAFGYMNNARDSWWDRNQGMVMGLGSVASVAAAAGLGGNFAPLLSGAEAGTAGAGAGAGLAEGSLSGIEGLSEYGFSNVAPVTAETAGGGGWTLADTIAAGQAAGADVGMGGGTSWLTSLGLPASYGSGIGVAAEYGLSALGGGGGGMGLWDTVSGIFGGGSSGGNSLTGNGLAQVISALIGAGGSYMGGQATQDANDKATDALMQMYYQIRADTAGQRALFDLIAPQLTQQAQNPNYPTIPTLQNQVSVDYAADPIYQQQKSEIMNTLNRRMASQGRFNSSAADDSINRNLSALMQDSYSRNLDTLNRTNQNALTTYGLGYQQNNDLYGRSLDLAKIGSGAAAQAGQNSLSTGQGIAGLNQAQGQNDANMWGGIAGSAMGGINNYMLYNLLNQRRVQ